MRILGIETSCDETSASVVENGRKILSNVVASQVKAHAPYFGVVPELASRTHLENINFIIEKALSDAKISLKEFAAKIDVISYTRGPGLAGSLLVGQVSAKALSFVFNVPLIDVNHLEGHLYAALLENKNLKPPYLCLIASGGHTELVIVKKYGVYKYLGGTRDDAAGEAFDKVAKLLNLSYPGGPVIDKLAKKGNSRAVKFPRPYMWQGWEFSFSGLKTSVVNYVRSNKKINVADVCASFQCAVVDTLVNKTIRAAEKFKMKNIVIGGGVAANSSLREEFVKKAKDRKLNIFLPSIPLCTDNAAMISCAGYYKFKAQKFRPKGARPRPLLAGRANPKTGRQKSKINTDTSSQFPVTGKAKSKTLNTKPKINSKFKIQKLKMLNNQKLQYCLRSDPAMKLADW